MEEIRLLTKADASNIVDLIKSRSTIAAQLSTPLTPNQVYDMILSASTRVVGLS